MRLAIVASHPIQYQAPLFRELARRIDLAVFFAHRASQEDQAEAGFGVSFNWDIDLVSGYEHGFLNNVAKNRGLDNFAGCDTPEIVERLRRGNFDAVLVMGWHLKCFWQTIWAAKRAGLPVLVRGDSHLHTRRSSAKRAIKQAVYPVLLRTFDVALYVGEHSRRYFEHYRYPRERMMFSPHCVDNAWFAARATPEAGAALRAARGIAPDAKVVLFAGKLLPFKRPDDVLKAAAVLAMIWRPVEVMIAGAGPLAHEITALADASGVRLINLGFCNQTEMPAAYAATNVLALPSEGETWGLVANEAMASGKPIIVSDACGCAPDLAADGLAGRVVPLGDIDALAAAMIDLLCRPPGRRAIGDKIGRYSLSAAADGIIEAVGLVASTRAT